MNDRIALAKCLAEIAGENGIDLLSCCGDYLVSGEIKKAHCVDAELLYHLFPGKPLLAKGPTRAECGCAASRDIGAYDTCVHGCAYCYANVNKDVAGKRHKVHDPEAEMLIPASCTVAAGLTPEICQNKETEEQLEFSILRRGSQA